MAQSNSCGPAEAKANRAGNPKSESAKSERNPKAEYRISAAFYIGFEKDIAADAAKVDN
jgi:hypothetical protein